MKYLTMNNGLKIPILGTGTNTFGKKNKDFHGDINFDTSELLSAINLGYRLIDTAIYYRNEAVIGQAVKASHVAREDFFITSKIPEKEAFSGTDDLVKFHVDASLKAIDLGYIDLYLVHFPLLTNEDNVRVWRILERYVDQGLIKSIGVSNFNESQLTHLLTHARIQPAVNQFLSYPGKHQQSLIDFCQRHGIIPEAYQSIKKVSDRCKMELINLAQSYRKTWSQVVLNYQVNQGIVVIPKSHNPLHQFENMDIFDFALTKQDIQRIRDLRDE
jgi:diketogulonate reductase-like aldo/keto reductase